VRRNELEIKAERISNRRMCPAWEIAIEMGAQCRVTRFFLDSG